MRSMRKYLTAILASTVLLTGCKGGGGGNNSVGGQYFTHEELAEEFVHQLNEFLGYDVELEKVNTEEFDYIVVYDYDFNTYDAYYLGGFNPGENIQDYVNIYDSDFFFDLDYIGGNLYEDPYTGTLFSKSKGAYFERNLSKVKGQEQELLIDGISQKIAQSYSLSEVAANKLAKAAVTVAVMNRRGSGEQAYKVMMENVTGTNVQQWTDAISSGNAREFNNLVGKAANTLGTDSADLRNTLGTMFFGPQ